MPKLAGMTLNVGATSGATFILYTSPSTKNATINFNITNGNGSSTQPKIGLCPAGATTITGADVINYITVATNSTLKRTGIAIGNGQRLLVYVFDTSGFGVTSLTGLVWGYEEQ